jgi:hypothetical protein
MSDGVPTDGSAAALSVAIRSASALRESDATATRIGCSYKWRMGKEQRQQVHDVYPPSTPQEPELTDKAGTVMPGVVGKFFMLKLAMNRSRARQQGR